MNNVNLQNPALDVAQYSLSDLVKVMRLPIGTVRMWLERKILALGQYDKDATGKGSQRRFTLRTIYFAATMAEITRLGVSPSIATRWADHLWRDSTSGILSPYDDMVLIGNPTNKTVNICCRNEISAETLFYKTVWPGEEDDLSVVVVDVSALARRCRANLGLQQEQS
jgi:hypothetical protein